MTVIGGTNGGGRSTGGTGEPPEETEGSTGSAGDPTGGAGEQPGDTGGQPGETGAAADGRAADGPGRPDRTDGDPGPSAADYEVRRYEDRDRPGYLALYDAVLGDASPEWFAWKYENNPFMDHVPTVVATHEGRVVGAKSGLALPVAWGDHRGIAVQPCDVMVHADHRRRGLYSRMTEHMKAVYRDGEPALFFNFPNPETLAGSKKHGWRVVGEVPTHYRIQDPGDYLPGDGSGPLGTGVRATWRALLGALDSVAGKGPPVTVNRHESVPVETLAALYRWSRPEGYHVPREERFYRWRFGNPRRRYEAYTVGPDDAPTLGCVLGRSTDGDRSVAALVDVVPASAGDAPTGAYRALLARIRRDHGDADVVAVAGGAIPPSVRRRFGFLSDRSLPLSRVARPTVMVAYPLSDAVGEDVFDRANWRVGLADMDTR